MARPRQETLVPGTQTLVRGLNALVLVSQNDGITLQELTEALSVHRTAAYRLLATLTHLKFTTRTDDGRYRLGPAILAIGGGYERSVTWIREISVPIMRALAEDLTATVALMVKESKVAVAAAVVLPSSADFHLAFREGSFHPLDRGSAGPALLAADLALPGESQRVAQARQQGWAEAYSEVEQGAYSVSAVIDCPAAFPRICITAITLRRNSINTERVLAAGRDLSSRLSCPIISTSLSLNPAVDRHRRNDNDVSRT
jgi:DNA-binding IclR family transcriptional regulator